jgi:hypothetical protein
MASVFFDQHPNASIHPHRPIVIFNLKFPSKQTNKQSLISVAMMGRVTVFDILVGMLSSLAQR